MSFISYDRDKCALLFDTWQVCVNTIVSEISPKVQITLCLLLSILKTSLLLSNIIDADNQKGCLFTNKGHFSLPLWVLIGVPAKFHE